VFLTYEFRINVIVSKFLKFSFENPVLISMQVVKRFIIILSIFLHYSVGNVAFSITIPLFDTLARIFLISPGFVEALFILLVIVSALGWGLILDSTTNRKRVILVSSLIWIVASWFLATAVTDSLGYLVFRVIMGIGVACQAPFSFALIGDLAGFTHRGKISSWLSTIGTASVGMGILFTGILNVIGGWQLPFLVISITGLLTLVFLLVVPHPPKGAEEPELKGTEKLLTYGSTYKLNSSDIRSILANRTNFFILVQGLIALIPSTILTYWLIAFLDDPDLDGIGLTSLVAIVIGLLFASGRIFGYPFLGYLGDVAAKYNKRGKGLVATTSMLLQAPVFMLAMIIPLSRLQNGESLEIVETLLNYPGIMVFGGLFFLAAFIGAGSAPNKTSILYDINLPENRSVVQSMYTISDEIGTSLALLLGSITIPLFGYRPVFFTAVSLYLIAALFWYLASYFYPLYSTRLRDIMAKRSG
jgi:MFS family permease